MKKNYLKKLASVLSLALVVSSITPASSASVVAATPDLAKRQTNVYDGKSYAYTVKNAAGHTVKWTVTGTGAEYVNLSANTGTKTILTVDTDGEVAAKNKNVTVKANFYKGKKLVKGAGDVIKIKVSATGLGIVPADADLDLNAIPAGEVIDFNRTITPSNATSITYWSVIDRDGNVATDATIDGTGNFKADKVGEYTVKAVAKNAKTGVDIKTAEKDVKVGIAITPPTPSPSPSPTPTPTPDLESKYNLVWNEEFEGTELSMDDWNYETREPGWVNNELQEYTDSTNNIYVKDGNLVIKALKSKVMKDGVEKDYYTSGKVTTQNKHNFKYGKFEIRAKVPSGKGLWPALWMMPSDESFYGQWPKCGEIDIMEVLGHETNVAYGTIHYGEPHKEQQGKYVLKDTTFADDYHTYAVEWEPDEMRFYIDGHLYHTVNDWFTKVEGKGEVTYPAPFDQPFFMQINLAVGGNWPGNPDESTDFNNAELMVDYVKVYQKDSYDENVRKPEKTVNLREPDSTGNYIVNGNFEKEDLSDDLNWGAKYALGGVGNVTIDKNELIIETINQGTVDYSIQIVQPNLPMKKGGEYKLTFDAYSDEARNMIVDISGPDSGYVRYLPDKVVTLGTEKQTYEYLFTMTEDSDANGRLEFNLGNRGSTGKVYITNVRLSKMGEIQITEPERTVLPDGNYVYNGEFQEGINRMEYWNVETNVKGANISVTNISGRRELMVVSPKGTQQSDVIIKQDEIALMENMNYILTFDAYADSNRTIMVEIDGKQFNAQLTGDKQQLRYRFSTSDIVNSKELLFALGGEGITYIDNVRIAEDGMIINGDFRNGFVGWEPFVDAAISSQVSYVVDSLTESNAAAFEINNTGSQDWQIQLKQNNIQLEEGKWYKLSFKAKTNKSDGRSIMVALQRNGAVDNDWTPYSGSKTVSLLTEYQDYELVFNMKNPTDLKTILAFSMGAVGGNQINSRHNVIIDNIQLEETEAVIIPDIPIDSGNMIKNSNFDDGINNWVIAITAPGAATTTVSGSGITYDISNVGLADWNIQLKQGGITLQQGHTYQVKMNILSDKTRTIKNAFLTSTYAWYGGADISLESGVRKEFITTFYVDKETNANIDFILSMGLIDGVDTPVGKIEIADIVLEDITE